MRIRHDYLDPQTPEDQVLVVVFLRGGADGLTLVPPVNDDGYRRARPTIGVSPADAMALDDVFSLNAELRPLMRWYEQGEMAIVHGAGSEDATRSHFEAQDFMEHAGNTGGGWLARYLRARPGGAGALCAVSIGTTLPESLRGAPGGAVIQTVRDFSLGDEPVERTFTEELARLYAGESGSLGQAARDTIEAIRRLRALRADDPGPQNAATYPDGSFGRGLREIVRLIRADVGLVASTIDLDGWDTHFGQGALIGGLMRTLAQGIDAFLTDLGPESRRVTVVVMTEFGRRVAENSSLGTDHGLASVMFAIGSGIRGGQVISRWRDVEAAQLVGPGDIPVGINYRDVLAPILARNNPGLDLGAVFPRYNVAPLGITG